MVVRHSVQVFATPFPCEMKQVAIALQFTFIHKTSSYFKFRFLHKFTGTMSLSQSAQQLPIPLLQPFPQPAVNFQSPSFAGHIPADPDSSTTSSSSGSGTPFCTNASQRQSQQQLMLSASSIGIELANKELWEKFHRVTNEMVVTRPGRWEIIWQK